MDEKGQNTSVNRSEETRATATEQTIDAPHFDAAAIERAKPAVPLSSVTSRRSWPTSALLAIAILSGLGGGVVGGLLPTLYMKEDARQNSDPEHTQPDTEIAGPGASTTQQPPSQIADEESGEDSLQRDSSGSSVEAIMETPSAKSVAEEQTGETERAATHRALPKETEAALRSALNDWVAATNARDIDRQMLFYNPVVEAFYRSRNASRADVRADKARVFERATSIDVRAGSPDIRLSSDGQTAIMRFRKRYAIEGGGEDRRGEVLQELRWQRINGQWRIMSERDLRVVR